jgi:hypothetical protein
MHPHRTTVGTKKMQRAAPTPEAEAAAAAAALVKKIDSS